MSILDFFRRNKSANTAKERLKMVLTYERKDLPPSFREQLQKDIMELFKKYPQLNATGIEIDVKSENEKDELYISIPFNPGDAGSFQNYQNFQNYQKKDSPETKNRESNNNGKKSNKKKKKKK